jgi:hypothetical protein
MKAPGIVELAPTHQKGPPNTETLKGEPDALMFAFCGRNRAFSGRVFFGLGTCALVERG